MPVSPPSEFIALSSLLTGFSDQTLIYAHQSADFYGEFSKIYGNQSLAALLTDYQNLKASGKSTDEIADYILTPGTPIAVTARALMVFWYLGQVAPESDPTAMQIPTANHYAQGLAWRAVQAHPTGVSTLQFGYWQSPPPPLDDFL